MPGGKRHQHSRSKSRSRSPSHDRERDLKRRKVDNLESPHHRRSVSQDRFTNADVISTTSVESEVKDITVVHEVRDTETTKIVISVETKDATDPTTQPKDDTLVLDESLANNKIDKDDVKEVDTDENTLDESRSSTNLETSISKTAAKITPKKPLTPKQLQRHMEIEKKRAEKKQQREELARKKNEEKERVKKEKLKIKEEKRKEKVEKEAEKVKKQKENSKSVFANFFVSKGEIKRETKEDTKEMTFKPFELKSDMRLAPFTRREFTIEDKKCLDLYIQASENIPDYLKAINRVGRKSGKTWPVDDTSNDVVITESNLGERIEDQAKPVKMRAKFLKFDENRRPAYYGTWRKRSNIIKSRNWKKMDKDLINYEVDSDEEWEEVGEGESLKGSDDEEKDENSDYEVDDEFFVPHGHLSEDELDDEEGAVLNNEMRKAKLKLLKYEFDEEHKTETRKNDVRVIGCVWQNNNEPMDEEMYEFLRPYAMIYKGRVQIKEVDLLQTDGLQKEGLRNELIPDLLKLLHGNKNNRKFLVDEYIAYLQSKNIDLEISRSTLTRQIKYFAQWIKCKEPNAEKSKYAWFVSETLRKKHNLNLTLNNQWNYVSKVLNEN